MSSKSSLVTVFLLLSAIAVGCASSSSARPDAPTGDDGIALAGSGGSSSGGQSGSAGSASTLPTQISTGAAQLTLGVSPQYPTAICMEDGIPQAAGSVDGSSNQVSSMTAASCMLQTTGTTSTFSVSVTGNGLELDITDGTIDSTGVGTASVTLTVPQEPLIMYRSPPATPCTVSVSTTVGPSLTIGAGTIWAAFSCPVLQNPMQAPGVGVCAIPGGSTSASPPFAGYFYVNNCED